jgi:hypothetical protein
VCVCLCVFVFVCVCMYAYMRVRMYICMHRWRLSPAPCCPCVWGLDPPSTQCSPRAPDTALSAHRYTYRRGRLCNATPVLCNASRAVLVPAHEALRGILQDNIGVPEHRGVLPICSAVWRRVMLCGLVGCCKISSIISDAISCTSLCILLYAMLSIKLYVTSFVFCVCLACAQCVVCTGRRSAACPPGAARPVIPVWYSV